MTMSPDHPQLRFIQAAKYGKGRPDGRPLWLVVHDMEAEEKGTTAESTAAYFAGLGPGDRTVSAHYTADNNSVIQCVLLADTAWTVGNRQGNYRGVNYEMAGYARQSRAEWLDPFGLAMFDQLAPIMRADGDTFDIPLVHRTRDELADYVPGVTSHADLAAVFGGSDHTDPGPNFPWDVFMHILTGGVATMLRYQFQGFPDNPPANPAGGPSRVHLTDGVRYRVQQYGKSIDKLASSAGAGPITLVTPGNSGLKTYAIAVSQFCGRLDPGEYDGDGAAVPIPPAIPAGPFTFTGTGQLKPATA